MFIMLNNSLVKREAAVISPFDHGFLYGVGLFETFRVYNGHCFLLDDHLERLNESLEILNIKKKFTRTEVEGAVNALLEANGYREAYIRFNVSAGTGEIGLQSSPYEEPGIIVFSKPLGKAGRMQEKEAVFLKLNRNSPEGEARLKSHHYLNNLLAWRELKGAQGTEGIFLTSQGFVAEGIVSNLFWVHKGVMYTPAIETGILNGITRQFVMKIASRSGIIVREGFFAKEDLQDAEEIFFTNSIQEIAAVTRLEGKQFPGSNGKTAQLLHNQYASYRSSLFSRCDL